LPAKKTSSKAAQPVEPAKAVAAKLPEDAKGRVFLIDAMSFIFRAYHAMARQRPMSTKTGVPTSATYVFVNMLNKLRKDFAPEYIAAVFDVAAPTFRDEQAAAMPTLRKYDRESGEYKQVAYDGYKAQRAAMPEDLAQQVPYIRRALEIYRIPILEAAGFEADDVIGTLARLASAQSYAVYVVSSDKDMLQLVDERVCVLNPPKDNLICDRAKVEEILGVPPERVIDVMALRGDAIDNVPGAPGIGDKGSVELIQRYGSLDNLLEHVGEVERKTYRESLLHNRAAVLLSRELVTIDRNVAVEFNPTSMKAQPPDVPAARQLFTELEFTSLVKEFLEEGAEIGETDYREAKSASDVEAVFAAVPEGSALAFGVEATAPTEAEEAALAEEVELITEEADNQEEPPPLFASTQEIAAAHLGNAQRFLAAALKVSQAAAQRPQRIAISAQPGTAMVVQLNHEELRSALTAEVHEGAPLAVHDYKASIHAVWRNVGLVEVRHDPMLYSYLLDPTYSSYTLKDVALRKLSLSLKGEVAEAADLTGRLTSVLRKEVEEAGLAEVYEQIDLPLVPVLFRMEEAGVKLDCELLAGLSERLARDCDAKARDIYAKAGVEFNINSPKQLGEVLFNRLNLPKPLKYGKGRTISTAQDVLEALAAEHEVPRLVLDYRQLSKLKSTYVDALPVLCRAGTSRLHTSFNQVGTATGRLSSNNPNLQNIPIRTELGREIRAAFIAEPGNLLLAADYSQIELRLLAHFSEDPLLVEAYRRGDDIHTLTAAQVFGVPPLMIDAEHRRRAKAVNFGIVYGLSPFGLSQQLGIDTKEAKRFIDAYFEKYKGVTAFIEKTLADARRDGLVRTLFGRVRPIPDILSKNANLRGFAERTAVNTPLQGTAADLIKLAMIRIDRELHERNLHSRMLLQVHDELVFEAPEKEVGALRELVKREMEQVHALLVPLVVEIGVGLNWRDME
jgi:DNA polymerase-1